MEDCALYFDDEFLEHYNGTYIEHTSVTHEMQPAKCSQMILVYVAHGSGEFTTKNSKKKLEEGDIILINPDLTYRIVSDKADHSISMYVCVFDKKKLPYSYEKITKPFRELSHFVNYKHEYIYVHDTPHYDIRNLMVSLIDEFSYAQQGYDYLIRCRLVTTLISVFRLYAALKTKKIPQNDNHIVGYMYNYANRHLYRHTSLQEVADMLSFAPQYICTVFKNTTGLTFTQYINNLRVEKIRDSLEHTDRPIYMIMDDFDFSPRYLNRLFKKHTGYNLQEYKNKFNYKVNNPLYPK
ncbi:MAG: helix-turn-helix domain-containing protein [Candidatus Ornithomonoglobus sp.]